MAKAKDHIQREKIKKVTSIGAHPTRSTPKNKHILLCLFFGVLHQRTNIREDVGNDIGVKVDDN